MASDLERLAKEFRQRGFREFGDSLIEQAKVARKLGAPEHFAEASTQAPLEESAPLEVRRFSDEARVALEREGYIILTLTGQSIASLREAGRKIRRNWDEEQYPQLEALTSMQSEVAIKPDQLFIPDSNNKTLAAQEEMINRFSQELGKRIPGVDAIMASVADYVDLAFSYLDKTGDYLFGKKYGYNCARTNTPVGTRLVAEVGSFDPGDGLSVSLWFRDGSGSHKFAAPLVVPIIKFL